MNRIGRRIRNLLIITMVIGAAQVVYWVVDEQSYSARMTQAIVELNEQTWSGVAILRAEGVDEALVNKAFPDRRSATAEIERLEALRSERASRVRRYVAEGSFFLVILLGALGITLEYNRRESEIRRRQDNMLAAVSHEFKSPIASLQLSAETLERRDLDPRGRRVVARMLDELRRLELLVFNFLDASRIQQGRLELHPEEVSVDELVESSLAAIETRASKLDVSLKFVGESGLSVTADSVAAKACVQNILDNALKATGGDTGSSIQVRASAVDGWVHLDVEDDGCGFDPDEATRIFEKFYRIGDELRRETKGTGLGLFLVRALMEAQRGKASAFSPGLGQGARLRLSWVSAGASS